MSHEEETTWRTTACLSLPPQVLLEGRPERGSGNSVAIFEIHIVPGYCIGQPLHFICHMFQLDVQNKRWLPLSLTRV